VTDSPLWKVGRVVVAVVVVVAAFMWLLAQVPDLNPFRTETQDRTGPAMLQSVRDLSQYHAAEGDFQVIVDLEHDVAWVPDAIAGNRTLFVARGSVSAYIDLGTLSDKALTVDEEKKTVQVRLPAPKLAKPNIDQEHTYLYSQQRGVFDRVKSLFETADQREFYVLAEKRIGDAAKEAGLTARAERNTRQMLTGLFTSLGYKVSFPDADNA
jgi:cytoskeletal protein RodZ